MGENISWRTDKEVITIFYWRGGEDPNLFSGNGTDKRNTTETHIWNRVETA